ncbi:uncharacterized protein M421DRAFT_180710 [Didymella exigua CBS 183.55]|uniref:SET domain-containing protein n=1 Tax=Didymella exigua CBS 183.55 TaxID=1150837 RepID=A0A6A5RJ77_9PLEO|nr:uncharacterized protein M421DRAFT_180710 [Didymella exigua CBS 183.55]KAF1927483.1 hypothetical protein M421DRAFT_180710 [Didymella exigua CBS 183.55]
MLRKPSTASAAQARATDGINFDRLALGDGRELKADEQLPPSSTGEAAKKRRYKKRTRRSNNSKSAAVGVVEDIAETEPNNANVDGAESPTSDTDTVATEPFPQFQLGRALPQHPRAFYVEIPVLAHYALRELPNVGDDEDDNDEGLFATQKIEPGTRIISEQPLFTLPAPGDQVPQLMAAYENLSESDQERIWKLRPAAAEASDALMSLRFLIDKLAVELQTIMYKSEAERTAEEKTTLSEMRPKSQFAMNVYRVAARWHANKCSLLDMPLDQRADLPNGTPVAGLFIERAHIRHSCVPNCFASYDADLGRMNVHTTRDVAPGEELTCSSFADTMYYSNAKDRKQELFSWGLTCDCEACDEKHPKFNVHETARQRAHTRAVLLNDVLTRLEKEDMTEDDLKTAQKLLLDLVRDLKTSGCESVETVRWRNILVDRILPARALVVPEAEMLVTWQVILHHAKESETVGKMCYGEDSENYRVLKQTREGTEATL